LFVTHREETTMADSTTTSTRLVGVDELGERQVTVIETPHGALAVGVSGGEPFAVSNRCRHLFASLGEGHVAEDGCLQCPWHAARYDVHTGAMTRGPQGAFKPLAGLVKGTTGARALKTFPVVLRDGAIWLEG
jgi:3-phenylpropionate/trans-cinnamate dioxygenase ferredoxin subunit